jgi:hypothetical protein
MKSRKMTGVCQNPNCLNNSTACPNFEEIKGVKDFGHCNKEDFCDWKRGLNMDSVKEHCFTRNIMEPNQ